MVDSGKGAAGVSGAHLRHVVLHGPESTGKSTLAARLAAHFGTVAVPEFGRLYCEAFGTDLLPEDLVRIMEGHGAMTAGGRLRADRLLISDTDPLMTAAWSMMMFGHRMDALDAFADVADLYLLMDDDLPWVADAVRMYADAADRRRFALLCKAELARRGVRHVRISGDGEQRFARAVAAIEAAGLTR